MKGTRGDWNPCHTFCVCVFVFYVCVTFTSIMHFMWFLARHGIRQWIMTYAVFYVYYVVQILQTEMKEFLWPDVAFFFGTFNHAPPNPLSILIQYLATLCSVKHSPKHKSIWKLLSKLSFTGAKTERGEGWWTFSYFLIFSCTVIPHNS